MSLTCCMLALALFGADDPKPSQPQLPSNPFVITIEIGGSAHARLGTSTDTSVAPLSESGAEPVAAVVVPALAGSDENRIEIFRRRLTMLGYFTSPQQQNKQICRSLCDAASPAQPDVTQCENVSKTAEDDATPVVCSFQMLLQNGTLRQKPTKTESPAKSIKKSEIEDAWPMTLSEATRIALDNSEIVRVITCGDQGTVGGFSPTKASADHAPIVISRTNADAAIWRFKSEVMAQIRSVEQMYWKLAQAHVALWAADRAFNTAQKAVKEEELFISLSPHARGDDVAEAKERLEQFKRDLLTRTSDVAATERQLRNILGLPPADNRRIIPVTPPTEARLEPDWDTSLAQMINFQPDIVQQQLLVRVAELQLLIARNQSLPQLSMNALDQLNGLGQQLDSAEAVMTGSTLKALNAVIANMQRAAALDSQPGSYSNFVTWQPGFTFQVPLGTRAPLANTRQAQYTLLRARAYLQQVMHQTTHSMARFFLEIDANYKQYAVAQRLRIASEQRLEAQRRYFESGKITVDRFFDAIAQYATAVANEHQYLASYNTSLVALSEAKGTLLADRNIVVAEKAPANSEPQLAAAKKDEVVTTTQATVQTGVVPTGAVPPPLPFATFTAPGPDLCATINTGIAVPMKAASPVEPPSTRAKEKALSWTISIKIGDSSAIELKGTIGANAQREPSKTVD